MERLDNMGPDLDTEFETFSDMSDDNWDGLVNVGIPLYKKLVEAGDARAQEVKDSLGYYSKVIENSEAGSDEYRAELRRRIAEGIK